MNKAFITDRPLVIAVLIGFSLWLALQLLAQAFWVIILVTLSLLAATAMMPVVRLVERIRFPRRDWQIPRSVAAILIYVVGGVLFGLTVFGVQALIREDIVRAVQGAPEIASSLARALEGMASSVGLSGIIPDPEEIRFEVRTFLGRATDALGPTVTAVGGIIGFFFRLFLVLTLALFLVIEADDFFSFVINLFPPEQRGAVARIVESIGDKIGRWVLGQLAVATIAGVLAAIAAALMGLPYPVLIGLATVILDLAPAVGPGVMTLPVFFLGLNESLFLGLIAALVFLALSQFDGNVLSPLIMGKAAQLSPAVVVIAITLGVALYGILGALIAVPVAMVIHVFIEEILRPWLYDRHAPRPSAGPPGPK